MVVTHQEGIFRRIPGGRRNRAAIVRTHMPPLRQPAAPSGRRGFAAAFALGGGERRGVRLVGAGSELLQHSRRRGAGGGLGAIRRFRGSSQPERVLVFLGLLDGFESFKPLWVGSGWPLVAIVVVPVVVVVIAV